MNYVAPLALFVFFLGVLALQGLRRAPPRGELGGPTSDERRAARALVGVLLTGWALLMAAILGPEALIALLVPAGLIFVLAGLALRLDYRGARRGFAADEDVIRTWAPIALILPGIGIALGGLLATLT